MLLDGDVIDFAWLKLKVKAETDLNKGELLLL